MQKIERYSDEALTTMLHDLESDYVERKESFAGDTPTRAREVICAFANDLPNHNKAGVLFIGAADDGSPSGLKITDRLLLTLSDMKTDGNILPFPVITVEKRTLDGAEMAVVTVVPSDSTPVKYDGRIWIRTGPRRALADEQEERILSEKRQSKNIPFDLRPVYQATINDLSRGFFEDEYLPSAIAKEILEANHRSYEERLAACLVSYRNRNLAEVMKNLDLGQRFGFGIKWARETMAENGNPPIEFNVSNSNVRYVLRTKQTTEIEICQ